MKSFITPFVEQMVENYKKKNIPHQFSLNQVDGILKEKYLAVEESVSDADIDQESRIHAIKYYVITDENVLQRVFTAIEKIDFFELMNSSDQDEKQTTVEKMWTDIQYGQRINVILESMDHTYITGFTLQGMSEKLFHELNVFVGIDPGECTVENECFLHYLRSLVVAGYL
ncbi:hypothetical protein [Rossellomorea sp. NPDC077527]|uniref:hypothetical protein n=1 Tax=Rossellomorea sp. NPDC077527 TaxID=3364510 RepID=UPI0037CB939E